MLLLLVMVRHPEQVVDIEIVHLVPDLEYWYCLVNVS